MSVTPIDLFNTQLAYDDIVAALKNDGFILRMTKKPDERYGENHFATFKRCAAANEERGVKLGVCTTTTTNGGLTTSKEITVDVSIRNQRGRYIKTSGFHLGRNSYTPKSAIADPEKWTKDVIRTLGQLHGQKVDNPLVATRNDLQSFPPLRFEKPAFVWGSCRNGQNDKHDYWMVASLFRACRVVGVVSILKNLKISTIDVSEPGVEPWFHVTGECYRKDTYTHPELIVCEREGHLVYYPVRYSKVTNEFKQRHTHIDYNDVTQADEALIGLAIKTFTANL